MKLLQTLTPLLLTCLIAMTTSVSLSAITLPTGAVSSSENIPNGSSDFYSIEFNFSEPIVKEETKELLISVKDAILPDPSKDQRISITSYVTSAAGDSYCTSKDDAYIFPKDTDITKIKDNITGICQSAGLQLDSIDTTKINDENFIISYTYSDFALNSVTMFLRMLSQASNGTFSPSSVTVTDNSWTYNSAYTKQIFGDVSGDVIFTRVSDTELKVKFTIAKNAKSISLWIPLTGIGKISTLSFEDITSNTPNLSDNASSTAAAVVKFQIGSKTYWTDGHPNTMEVAPYIQDGYTMVPVRYVARALGVPDNNVNVAYGIVTINYQGKVIQLRNYSKYATVNNEQIELSTAPSIMDNRICIPVGEIARLLDVKAKWDGTNKTVVFSK